MSTIFNHIFKIKNSGFSKATGEVFDATKWVVWIFDYNLFLMINVKIFELLTVGKIITTCEFSLWTWNNIHDLWTVTEKRCECSTLNLNACIARRNLFTAVDLHFSYSQFARRFLRTQLHYDVVRKVKFCNKIIVQN